MEDKEMLEWAAKAAGIRLEWDGHPDEWQAMYYEGKTYHSFDPRNDYGDALRLAVILKFGIDISDGCTAVISEDKKICILDKCTRLAITKAAEQVGKAMP